MSTCQPQVPGRAFARRWPHNIYTCYAITRWSIQSTRQRPLRRVANALILLPLLDAQPTLQDLPLVPNRSFVTHFAPGALPKTCRLSLCQRSFRRRILALTILAK